MPKTEKGDAWMGTPDSEKTQDSTALDRGELAFLGFGRKGKFKKMQAKHANHLVDHAVRTGYSGTIMKNGYFTKKYIAHIKKHGDDDIARSIHQFHHQNQLGAKNRLGYTHDLSTSRRTTAVVDAGPDPNSDDFHDLNAEHSMTTQTAAVVVPDNAATTTQGDRVGQIMDGRQFIGNLLDVEFMPIPVWYQPVNNQYFRGTSTLTIPDRTIAYGNWQLLTASGTLHVRKLRAFLDRMLPEERRVPDYQALKIKINPHDIIKSRDFTTAPITVNSLAGGVPDGQAPRDRRLWDDATAKAANDAIEVIVTQMLSAGFSMTSKYYSTHFREYDLRLDNQTLFNLSSSVSAATNRISSVLDTLALNFEPLDFQWPMYSPTGAPEWRAVASVGNHSLVLTIKYPTSQLLFDLV